MILEDKYLKKSFVKWNAIIISLSLTNLCHLLIQYFLLLNTEKVFLDCLGKVIVFDLF